MHLLDFCVSSLKEAGIPNYKKEVEFILSDVLDIPISEIYLNLEKPLKKIEEENIKHIVKERLKRIPLAYLLSHIDFYNAKLKLIPGVFAPRPETELLVEETLNVIKQKNKGGATKFNIIEVGTGSGAVAIAIALENMNTKIWATDISSLAISTAKQNAVFNEVDGSIRFIVGHLFDPLSRLGLENKTDIIVSNPPYIKTGDISQLSPEVKKHDPGDAIDGGVTGIMYIEKIIKKAPLFL